MDEYVDRLIQGYLDDALAGAELADFEGLMGSSDAARRRFWELAEVHGLAHATARLAWGEATECGASAGERSPVGVGGMSCRSTLPGLSSSVRSFWSQSRSLVAFGVAIGVLATSLAWGLAGSHREAEHLLLAESFEAGTMFVPRGVPVTPDIWGGDYAEIIDGQFGVEPASGMRMLQFLSADFEGKPGPGGYIGEAFRLLDVRDRRHELADGSAAVRVSAKFNSVAVAANEEYECRVSVWAVVEEKVANGDMHDGENLMQHALAMSQRSGELLDRDAGTWQRVVTELVVPPKADFLVLRIAVQPSILKDVGGHDIFAGHYADDVRVSLVRRHSVP